MLFSFGMTQERLLSLLLIVVIYTAATLLGTPCRRHLTVRPSVTTEVIRTRVGRFPACNVLQVSLTESLAVSTGLATTNAPLANWGDVTHLTRTLKPRWLPHPSQVEIKVPLVPLRQSRKFRRQGRLVCRTASTMIELLGAPTGVTLRGDRTFPPSQAKLPSTLQVTTLLTCLTP